MPQIINTNMASINAQRNLNKSQAANQGAMQRLSSGLRINSAKDDAAGLAISTRFTSQIKGLNVAVRNAGDGIALAQTAEGALGTMNDNLQRIRELAVQSSNATNSDVDRDALQAEVKQLVAEISRTAEESEFNGRKLLNGDFKAIFQVGANAGQTLDVSIAELTADKLGSSPQAGVSAQGTDAKLSNGDLTINGENIRASISGDDTLSHKDKEKSAIAKVAAINASSEQTGVTAKVDANVVVGSDMDTAKTASAAAVIKLNGVEIDIQGTDNSSDAAKAGTRGSVVAAINAKAEQTGVTASDGGRDGGVVLTAKDGRNITLESIDTAAGAGTAVNDLSVYGLADSDTKAAGEKTYHAGFTLTAKNANTDINITGGNDTGNGNIENSGLAVGNYNAQRAVTTNTDETISGATEYKTVASSDLNGATATIGTLDGILTKIGLSGTSPGVSGASDYSKADLDKIFKSGGLDVTANGVTAPDVVEAITKAAVANGYLIDGVDVGSGTLTSSALNAAAKKLDLNVTFADASGGAGNALSKDEFNSALKDAGYKTQLSGTGTTLSQDLANLAMQSLVNEEKAIDRALQDGDMVLNSVGVIGSSSLDDTASDTTAASSRAESSGIAIAAAINKSTEKTGVTATANATEVVGGSAPTALVDGKGDALADPAAAVGTTIALKINNREVVLTETGDYEKNKADAIAAINEVSGDTGVVATDNGESLTLTAADGRNISLYAYGNKSYDGDTTVDVGITSTDVKTNIANFGLSSKDVGVNSLATTASGTPPTVTVQDYVSGAKTTYSTVSLDAASAMDVGYGTNGAKGLEDSGFKAGTFGGGEDGMKLSDIDISTFEGAQAALVAVDNAIASVASQRADLGAIQNRMQSTVNNLQINSENLSAANSRIQDADFAAETAELSRTQVLQQAGISILAQANASGQQVLSLLG